MSARSIRLIIASAVAIALSLTGALAANAAGSHFLGLNTDLLIPHQSVTITVENDDDDDSLYVVCTTVDGTRANCQSLATISRTESFEEVESGLLTDLNLDTSIPHEVRFDLYFAADYDALSQTLSPDATILSSDAFTWSQTGPTDYLSFSNAELTPDTNLLRAHFYASDAEHRAVCIRIDHLANSWTSCGALITPASPIYWVEAQSYLEYFGFDVSGVHTFEFGIFDMSSIDGEQAQSGVEPIVSATFIWRPTNPVPSATQSASPTSLATTGAPAAAVAACAAPAVMLGLLLVRTRRRNRLGV